VLIRPIVQADAPLLAALHAGSFPPGEAWGAEAFARLLALPGTMGAFAAEGEVPVGLVLARQVADEAEILTLAVLPPWRRGGVGRSLLARVLSAFAAQGVKRVFLEVAAENRAACGLYAAVGFRVVGRRTDYYGSGRDALVLARALNPPCAG